MAVLCPREPQNYMRGSLVFWGYIFYLSKFYEFLDTVISIVRGHSVLPLHVYHHAVMPLLVWSWFVGNWPLHWCVTFVRAVACRRADLFCTLGLSSGTDAL